MSVAWMNFSYLVASLCFILTLQQLSSPKTARRGVLLGVHRHDGSRGRHRASAPRHRDLQVDHRSAFIDRLGHRHRDVVHPDDEDAGANRALALLRRPGGGARRHRRVFSIACMAAQLDRVTAGALGFEVFFGLITFTGSLMAFGKLQGFITGAPVTYPGQNVTNIGMFFGCARGR